MIREVNLDEISDGKRYRANDMVKADCNDCKGCFECCCGMGTSIILDPYDIFHMTKGLGQTFEQLLEGKIELNLVDGMILPNLVMDQKLERCNFLNAQGRCSIHTFRPGICRLFPLGRVYEDHAFQYFLQTQECSKTNRTKIKVKKWIDLPEFRQYEEYITEWHYFVLDVVQEIQERRGTDKVREINLTLLRCFFQTKYADDVTFYSQFQNRILDAKKYMASLKA